MAINNELAGILHVGETGNQGQDAGWSRDTHALRLNAAPDIGSMLGGAQLVVSIPYWRCVA